MSKAKQLAKMFGGTWTYDGCGEWACDDGERAVARTAATIDECGDAHGTAYVLYGRDGIGRRVFFGPNADIVNFP